MPVWVSAMSAHSTAVLALLTCTTYTVPSRARTRTSYTAWPRSVSCSVASTRAAIGPGWWGIAHEMAARSAAAGRQLLGRATRDIRRSGWLADCLACWSGPCPNGQSGARHCAHRNVQSVRAQTSPHSPMPPSRPQPPAWPATPPPAYRRAHEPPRLPQRTAMTQPSAGGRCWSRTAAGVALATGLGCDFPASERAASRRGSVSCPAPQAPARRCTRLAGRHRRDRPRVRSRARRLAWPR